MTDAELVAATPEVTDLKPGPDPADNVPMRNPSATCEHHFVSVHQPHFPAAAYWVRLCSFCERIEIDPGSAQGRADAELVALLLTEARAWRAFDHLAWIDAKRELQAAVRERLDAEDELRAAVLGRLEAEAENAQRAQDWPKGTRRVLRHVHDWTEPCTLACPEHPAFGGDS